MAKLFFDHAYTLDKSHRFYKSLAQRGFTVEKLEFEHPGKTFCRFLKFESTNSRDMDYLEFAWVKAKKTDFHSPGLSLGSSQGLERLHRKIEKKIPSNFVHKNYDWKRDPDSKLPGWNFVTFKKLPFTSYFFWITEYEKDSKKNARYKKPPKHKNTARNIIGMEIMVNDKGKDFYRRLLGKPAKGKVQLNKGFHLYFQDAKINKVKKIIVSCDSLEKFAKLARPDFISSFDGKESAVIKNPSNEWDLYIIER